MLTFILLFITYLVVTALNYLLFRYLYQIKQCPFGTGMSMVLTFVPLFNVAALVTSSIYTLDLYITKSGIGDKIFGKQD